MSSSLRRALSHAASITTWRDKIRCCTKCFVEAIAYLSLLKKCFCVTFTCPHWFCRWFNIYKQNRPEQKKTSVVCHMCNTHLGAVSHVDYVTKGQMRLETKVELLAAFMAQIQQTSVTGGVDLLPKPSWPSLLSSNTQVMRFYAQVLNLVQYGTVTLLTTSILLVVVH